LLKALPASSLLQTHGKTQAARQLARQDLGVAAFGEVFPGLAKVVQKEHVDRSDIDHVGGHRDA